MPQIPFKQCTATAPTGSSTFNLSSIKYTATQTRTPAIAPITKAPIASTFAHPAVIATRPARDPFKDMETSGFPFLIHVYSIAVQVATAGAIVVVAKICDNCMVSVAAAPLKPYHPNQRINTPSAPIRILCPTIRQAVR